MSADVPPILIVEDDADIREALVDALSDHGYESAVAGNGREALELLRQMPILPRVILLDLMMPVMDGFQFRAEQIKDAALSEIPVVLVTAVRDTIGAAEQMGAAAALRKPVTLADLLAVVAQFGSLDRPGG